MATESHQPSVRNHPIPPPSHPKQYRAIGLIRGQYTPSEDILTRGTFKTADNIEIPAVLLGRTLSLIKNHLDLSQSHLWVVYPRTRQIGDGLHIQIAGVWDPVALGPKTAETETDSVSETSEANRLPIQDGAFSIRGEVVFYNPEQQKVIVKIQQAPRRESEAEKSFKISLTGSLPKDKPLGHFWDIRALLQGIVLHIEAATDIGLLPPKKRSKRKSTQGKRDQSAQAKGSQKPRKATSSSDRAPRSEKPHKSS
ncbi:MAG: hypothetical protein ACLFT0_03395 [Spirulinaceae cyanobacterium]